MINDKIYFLSKIDMLAELNLQELSELAEDFQWQEFGPCSVIVSQDQERHWFYVLTAGKADVLVNKKGRTLQVGSFIAGDVFGEISLFTGKPSPVTVRSSDKCTVLALDPEHFAHMLIRWPILYERFLKKLSHHLDEANYGLWEARHKEFLRSGLQLNQLQYKFYGLWGSAKTTREVENRIAELAKKDEHLLLIGERGTGRQMISWYLHKLRFGEAAPFIVVDGRHFDQQWGDLMFKTNGHDSTSIKNSSLLEIAEGGTLFIREINLISPRAQAKLAEALQSREIECHVIGSLQADPEMLSERLMPQLRESFTQTYNITPLRERKKDISIIAQGILEKLAVQHNRKTPAINQEATKLLLSHHYRHGNVTELIQVVERAFFLAEDDTIGLEHVFFGPTAEKMGHSINLLSLKWIAGMIKKGVFPGWLQLISTAIFILIITLLFLAPQTKTGGILFLLVWGLWWPGLTILSPFFGRVWCGVCPFSRIMGWVQQIIHLNLPVPDFLKKYDYLFVTFLFLMVFWVEAFTGMRFNPLYTVIWLVCVAASASVIGIVFPRHTWCRHLCPLGGFVGMASVGGMLEVRADATVCLNKCTTHECYRGTKDIPGCPMSQYTPFVDNNIACKLCLNCARNCPNGAVQVNLRVPAREVWHLVRVNQGFTIFIGVSLAVLIPIIYFEQLYFIWPLHTWQLWFSIAFWGTALTAGGLTWMIARPFKNKAASRRIKLVFAFIPLVLAGYTVYQLHFLPGVGSIMFGLVYKSPQSNPHSLYIPALTALRVLAVIIGLLITGFTVIMVLLRSRQRRADGPEPFQTVHPAEKLKA